MPYLNLFTVVLQSRFRDNYLKIEWFVPKTGLQS